MGRRGKDADGTFQLAVNIIYAAHKDYRNPERRSHRKSARHFFQSNWYELLFTYCSCFVEATSLLEELKAPKELRDGL